MVLRGLGPVEVSVSRLRFLGLSPLNVRGLTILVVGGVWFGEVGEGDEVDESLSYRYRCMWVP